MSWALLDGHIFSGYWMARTSFTVLILEPALELLDRRVA